MPRRKYTDEEIKDLISYYKSELKKLQFRILETKEILEKLQGKVKDEVEEGTEEAAEKAPRKTRAKSQAKARQPKAEAKKPGKPKKRGRKKKRAPYKLSDHDNFVLELLDKEDRLLSRNDIEVAFKQYLHTTGETMTDEQVATKITRILQKLGTKRGSIRKFAISGRGYGYGLDKWFFGTTGKLKRKYIP